MTADLSRAPAGVAQRDHPHPVAGAAGHHPGLGPRRLRRQPLHPGPRAGHERTVAEQRHLPAPATIGYYGGLTVALFLIGWATGGILFGVLADYFGRTRVLSIGILTYAIFSALAAFADTWWQLGILRFIAGLGSGVEAPVGAALIAETWRNRFRARAGGDHDVGLRGRILRRRSGIRPAGQSRLAVHARAGRSARAAGLVHSPLRPGAARDRRRTWKLAGNGNGSAPAVDHDRFALRRLIEPPLLRPMLVCTALATGALIAFWSVTTWYPQIIRQITAAAESLPARRSPTIGWRWPRCCSTPAAIVGYASWGFVADCDRSSQGVLAELRRVGRRRGVDLFPFDRSYTEFLIACRSSGSACSVPCPAPSSTPRNCFRRACGPPPWPSATASAATSPRSAR